MENRYRKKRKKKKEKKKKHSLFKRHRHSQIISLDLVWLLFWMAAIPKTAVSLPKQSSRGRMLLMSQHHLQKLQLLFSEKFSSCSFG